MNLTYKKDSNNKHHDNSYTVYLNDGCIGYFWFGNQTIYIATLNDLRGKDVGLIDTKDVAQLVLEKYQKIHQKL